jgi:hypothetical protein
MTVNDESGDTALSAFFVVFILFMAKLSGFLIIGVRLSPASRMGLTW